MIRDAHHIHPCAGRPQARRGTIVALLALTIVGLIGFLGLAIDLGMLAIAKTQAQNAADVAALTCARSLTGDPSNTYNNATATSNAQNILTYNQILGQNITSSQLALTYGSYDYNQSTQVFAANYPATAGVAYTAVSATVTANGLPGAFSKIFGSSFLPNVSATAQAVHRPRDIALVMDCSGSMRFGTCNGYDFYTTTRTTNNPDSLIPKFGHYSSASAGLQGPTTNRTSAYDNYLISPSNVTVGNTSYSLTYVNNFYQQAAYTTPLVRAFDSYTSNDGGATWVAPSSGGPLLPPASYATTPGGDVPAYVLGSAVNYAKTVADIIGGSTTRNAAWELDGYSTCPNGQFSASALAGKSNYSTAPFKGYTQGPGYYGKTFFIWPPDPRVPLKTTGATWTLAGGVSGGADSADIKQFLTDFGYIAADFGNTSVSTTLSAKITNISATITVNATTGFPTTVFAQFKIVVGTEIMLVTAVGGVANKTWTVLRGQDGTTAASANSGTTVGLATGLPLYGIYSVTKTTGSQIWPWPNDGGTTLGNYLTANVYKPASSTKLSTTDDAYQHIMRLYARDYVVDSLGTTPCDWRKRFFGTTDNTVLFNSSGSLNPPGSAGMGMTALQTYNEILRWITQTTDPFPTQMRAGRVKYYGSIPTSITGVWPSYGGTDQRFWVEFIDYVLGYRQTSAGNYQDISAMAGYGVDFTWGTLGRNAAPSATQYMNYSDNPARGKLRHWFGPLAMVDSLNNYNVNINVPSYFFMQPGDAYEAPMYTGKEAYMAAVSTMEKNHPNDWFTLSLYSKPRDSATAYRQRFNAVHAPMGTNYNYARAGLLFPYSTIKADGSPNNTEITPYDADPATGNIPSANFVECPRADGETCFAMSLMLCYNQFAVTPTSDGTLRSFVTSSPITFPYGMAGGLGRKGAQKVIIFETDGLPNCTATASLVNATTYKYYAVRYDMNKPLTSEFPTTSVTFVNDPTVTSQVYSLVQQLAADHGTSRNPFRLYAIGFGPVFAGSDASKALQTLQTMQYYAGTQTSTTTPLASSQIITGTDAQMSTNMVTSFTDILQSGVQIALIK